MWVVTGDGDALSIGGNHLIHALRRNVNLTILLFNNRIYGLTKGQYSPTSEPGKVTKSTPMGSVDEPVQPDLAGARRRGDVRRPHHRQRPQAPDRACCGRPPPTAGASLVEIYQNCPIFNDGAFDVLKDRTEAQARLVPLEHGSPIVFGAASSGHGAGQGPDADGGAARAVVARAGGGVEVVTADELATRGLTPLVHDVHAVDPSTSFALSRLDDPTMAHVPIGVFRSVSRPTYDDLVRAQVDSAVASAGGPASGADLAALLAGPDTWRVG